MNTFVLVVYASAFVGLGAGAGSLATIWWWTRWLKNERYLDNFLDGIVNGSTPKLAKLAVLKAVNGRHRKAVLDMLYPDGAESSCEACDNDTCSLGAGE